jgi:hypothetical protein
MATDLRQFSRPANDKLAGEVVYIYALDVAYEMTRQPVRELLGQPVAQFQVDKTNGTALDFRGIKAS